jgi:hypothetical protein
MNQTTPTTASMVVCTAFIVGAAHLGADDASKFPTVPKMIEEFGDYFAEGRTFKLISARPLHIQISPVVAVRSPPPVIDSMVHMAAVETVYRAFIHTPVDKLTVTAIPKTLVAGDVTAGDFLTEYRVSLTVTRKQALALLNRYFTGKGFEDLVLTEYLDGFQ